MRSLMLARILGVLGLAAAVSLGGACAKATPAGSTTTSSAPVTKPAATSVAPTTARPSVATTSVPAPAAPTGPYGNLRIAVASFDIETLNPVTGGASEGLQMVSPIVDSLLRLDGTKLAPGVADSWEMATDGLSWTFRVHKGIKFQDGSDLTAADVKFSFEQYMAKDAGQSYLRNGLARVEVVDNYTVRAYTKGIQVFLPYYLSFYYPAMGWVLPKSYIEKNGIDYFKKNPMGSGPFKFSRYAPGDFIEYQALDKHWRQVPAFRTLTQMLIPEEATRVAMLKTGTAEIIDSGLESGRELKQAGFRTVNLVYAQSCILLWGAYVPESAALPMGNIKFRQALSYAINRDEIKNTVFYGEASPPLPGFLVPEAVDIDAAYWADQSAKVYNRYDPEESKRLLKEIGYPEKFASPTVKLYSYTASGAPYLPKLIEISASYLAKVGIKTEIIPTTWSAVTVDTNTLKSTRLVGAAGGMKVSGRASAPEILNTWVGTSGSKTMLQKAFPDVEKTIAAAAGETDAAKRKAMIAQVAKTISDAYVSIQFGGVPSVAGLGPGVDLMPMPVTELPVYAESVKHRPATK
ncbi:MAG: hypothetical protein HYY32_05375 [Chloroflexi bacterium]|nr:hypothetical protein [Chloroflexota bacterium]